MIGVLLLEDDNLTAEMVARMVRQEEAQVRLQHVTTVAAAVEALGREQFDVVLADLSLPDSEGRQTVRRLVQATNETPIVVLTAVDDEARAIEMLLEGAQDYIVKAKVSPELLSQAIRYAIQRHEQVVKIRRLLLEADEHRRLLTAENQELVQLNQQAQSLVDSVSHDFRTPLTVIKESAAVIRDELAGDVNDEQRRMLTIVEDRADELNSMVDDMLDVSKAESGLLTAWREPCNVADIVARICPTLERKSQFKDIRLEVDIAPDLPELFCDADKIGRVITNLAGSSMRRCDPEGRVSITVTQRPGSSDITVLVVDDGPGLDESELASVFDRLRHDGESNQSVLEIGLSVAQELVDISLGILSMESDVERGSTFELAIPINDPSHIAARFLRRAAKQPNQSVVSLVRVTIDYDRAAGEVNSMLNYLLQRNDLLIRTGDDQWLLAIPTNRDDLRHYFSRANELWRITNQHRPHDPLPELDMNWLGTWTIPEQADQVITEVERQTCCAT